MKNGKAFYVWLILSVILAIAIWIFSNRHLPLRTSLVIAGAVMAVIVILADVMVTLAKGRSDVEGELRWDSETQDFFRRSAAVLTLLAIGVAIEMTYGYFPRSDPIMALCWAVIVAHGIYALVRSSPETKS
jgi:archaellum biogenesis protein FlaJ (TadC family)